MASEGRGEAYPSRPGRALAVLALSLESEKAGDLAEEEARPFAAVVWPQAGDAEAGDVSLRARVAAICHLSLDLNVACKGVDVKKHLEGVC